MDALRRSSGVLKIDVLRRDLHIVQGGFDVGMTVKGGVKGVLPHI
jgi:hypothetical protein